MYTSFFGLNEKPFSITPDPRYLFMSERHGEALAHLVYGVTESGGFMQLTGEVGTGKTTLVRTLLQNRMPANADVAVCLNPQLSAREFLVTICEELGVTVPEEKGSIKALIDALNRHLLAAHADGRRTILVVDEAQNLAPEVLEEVRLLTNLETAKQKLLQIILIGQPELRDLLARNDLRQLAQRITGRYHLEPLSRDETAQYIEHRLKVAGALGEVFDAGAKREVFRLSQGVPRLINVICDRALLGAYSSESRRVNRRMIRRAAAEITGKSTTGGWLRRAVPVFGVAVAVVIVASFMTGLEQRRGQIDDVVDPPLPSVAQKPLAQPATDTVADAADPEPESESATETEPSLDAQLQLATDLTNTESALVTLLDLWGLEYRRGERGCAQAAAAGFECLFQRGSWSGLKQYDRPAILTLIDSTGAAHSVVLTAIDGENVELSIGGVAVMHPIDDVSEMWFGQYLLLWRPPTATAEALGPGSSGQDVVWLRQSLAAIDSRYQTAAADSDIFDAELQQQVRAFQRDHRLDVDGLAGNQTQIIINTLLAPDTTPRLTIPRLAQE
ncbi:MAG: AAA family ATPase [Gammaproteobacteria bacterium]|nr:AAA family ATPase [Gammaproteobacteria bacterium]